MKAALLLLAFAAAGTAGGCATVPPALQGDAVDISPAQARDAGRPGLPVRWGGRIVSAHAQGDRTCFELIGSQLSVYGRPKHMYDDGSGRFVACGQGFYDPAVYLKNRELTVLGRLDGFVAPLSGSYGYQRPRVAADSIHLWPEAPYQDPRYPYSRRPWPWAGWGWGDNRY
ncbi:MAG TPA: Slp family lipoprotein [Luteimonas sp.]|nr:Slp family lipoprotein [Luteimonas sp.]